MKAQAPFSLIALNGVFLFLDRFLKWQSTHEWNEIRNVSDYLGWEPFLNKGIAFGIPMPLVLIVLMTVSIVAVVLYLFNYHLRNSPQSFHFSSILGLSLIITGAVSNLVDRVYFGYTIDYFRVLNGVINMADLYILSGFVLYFSSLKHLK